MASSHLSNALRDLVAERDELSVRLNKLTQRMLAIESGIESLSSLLADDESEVVPHTPIRTEKPFELDPALPLWHNIGKALLAQGPMAGKDIAQFLLEQGYETRSGDFANVVGTNLRSSAYFTKMDDGRWSLADPVEFAAL
jgi:hypothetical protein